MGVPLSFLLTVAAQVAIGPVRVGQSFSEIVRLLGRPSNLHFPQDEMFDGILSFGPLEIYVQIVDDNVRSYLVQLHLFKSGGRRTFRIGSNIQIERPQKKELVYNSVYQELIQAGVPFRTNSDEQRNEGMHRFLQIGDGVRFYFASFGRKEETLTYIELGQYEVSD